MENRGRKRERERVCGPGGGGGGGEKGRRNGTRKNCMMRKELLRQGLSLAVMDLAKTSG